MDRYTLTENGLVAKFQQDCGCNAEGPKCEKGKKLYDAMSADSAKLWNDEMTLSEADFSLDAWQEHLGA